MKKVCIVTFICVLVCTSISAEKALTGFSGGMLLSGGFSVKATNQEFADNYSITNNPKGRLGFWGIGGLLRMHFFNHMHLGAEGYMSDGIHKNNATDVRIGWGGLLLDGYWHWAPRFVFSMGATFGGGQMKKIYDYGYSFGDKGLNYRNASYVKKSFFALDPHLSFEIAVSKKKSVHLIIRADYLLPIGKRNDICLLDPHGPRFYLGILFGKQ